MKKYYIKEINFLRFVSIFSVVIYHYFPEIIPRGYLGVDLFFVISGFLISFYIYKELEIKKFSLLNFYHRRIKRILPAAVFLLFFVSLISLIIFTKVDLINYSKSLIYSIFFSANFFFWLDGGYFGPNDKLKPLLHFWSLGVEEQFYIFFPVFFYLIKKFFKNINNLIWIILVITFLSFLLNIFLLNIGGFNPAFFLLPSKVWNFGFGILAMLLLVKKKQVHNNLEIIFLIILIIISFYYQIPNLPINFPIVFFSFMLLRKRFPKKFLFDFIINNKLIQYVGLISFSLYLWHWPIIVFIEYYFVYDFNNFYRILGLLISILLSIISYHLIELNYRNHFKSKSLYSLLFASYIFFISFFIIINSEKKIDYKVNSPNFIAEASLTNFKCEIFKYKLYNEKRGCLVGEHRNSYQVAIIGNSHAQMYVPSIKPHLILKEVNAILLPMTGCLPTLNVNINKKCMEISKNYFLDYSNDKKIKTIVLATTWWHKNLFDGEKFIDDSDHQILANSLLNLIYELRKKGKKVFLVSPIQVPLYDLPQDLSRLLKFNHINKAELLEKLKVDRKIFDQEYKLVNTLLFEKLNKNFIKLYEVQCDNQVCNYSNNEGIFFADASHISKVGSKHFSKLFEIIFE